jgi:nucleotide-binding universal stress UspA family protein
MPFQHILFPVDYSGHSLVLNTEVEWLAAQFNARVTLLHVLEFPTTWPSGTEPSLIDEKFLGDFAIAARDRLSQYALNIPESRINRVLAEGEAAWNIVQWANTHDVDLIMMGTHGHGKLHGVLLGSVAGKVMSCVSCPVWTDSLRHAARHAGTPNISRIVCSVDTSEETIDQLQQVDQLAREFDASVHLVHSVPMAETRPNRYLDSDLHGYLVEMARVEIAKLQREAGTAFPLSISHDAISQAIAQTAAKIGADLAVIGRGKIQKYLGQLRTHCHAILRDAPCPVLSYSLKKPDRISSSCSAEHRVRYAEDALPRTGSRLF